MAGIAVAAVLSGHQELLRNTIANTTLDLLHFSLIEWNTSRLALQLGLVLAHATALGLAVAILRVGAGPMDVSRGGTGTCEPRRLRAGSRRWWSGGSSLERQLSEQLPLLASAVLIALLALYGTRLMARFRHGSQAFRLTLLTLALIAPAFAFYPTWFQLAWRAKSQLVESLYARQAFNQRTEVQKQLDTSLNQIDALPDLTALVTRPAPSADDQAEAAFEVWRSTALAGPYPVTSSVELFDAQGKLVSRYAFNLPEDQLTAPPVSEESSCRWEIVGRHESVLRRRPAHPARRAAVVRGHSG